jgi:hypothetical protein
MNHIHVNAVLQSLRDAPLLVDDLPEGASLDRGLLGLPTSEMSLNENQKLGHLYEDALSQLLEASERLEILADHVQVFDANNITLGEMDYILRDVRTQQLLQLELAVKFYLGVLTVDGWQFPGPDPHDNYQRKLARMRTHQLSLAQRPEALSLLRQRWGEIEVEVRQLIYGCIFYPMGSGDCCLPVSVRPDCRKGRWLYRHEWRRFFASVSEVYIIPKPLWPVAMTIELRASLSCGSVEDLHSASVHRCVMFVLPDCDEPYFMVPNHWPNR